MPTISYDFNDAGDFADFIVLEAGNYVFEFKSAEAGESNAGNPKAIIDLIVKAASPANSWAVGGLLRLHMPTKGGGSGRFRALLGALGYNFKTKGSLKLEKYYGEEFGARVTKKPGDKLNEDGEVMYFNDLNQLMPGDQMRQILGAAADEEDEEYDEDEEEPEEDEELEEADDEDEEEEDEEDEDEDEDDEDDEDEDDEEELTPEDLDDMNLTELKELADEYGISTKPAKGKKKLSSAVMRKRLLTLWEDEEDEEEDEDADPF